MLFQLSICEVFRGLEVGSDRGGQLIEHASIAHQQIDGTGEQSSGWTIDQLIE